MNKLSLSLSLSIAGLLLLGSVPARAQVRVQIDLGLPAAPALVEVQPGIQVVEGFQEEVFFNAGWYWCRRPDGWYRARSARARFDWVDARRVPPSLARMPAGRYRNWHRGPRPGERRPEVRRERRSGQP
jgi:hypothetical protein